MNDVGGWRFSSVRLVGFRSQSPRLQALGALRGFIGLRIAFRVGDAEHLVEKGGLLGCQAIQIPSDSTGSSQRDLGRT